jgi:hypothetical protein
MASKPAARIEAAATALKTGFSLKLVVDKWSEAKAGLLQQLTAEWARDFNSIPSRVKHERARLALSQRKDR